MRREAGLLSRDLNKKATRQARRGQKNTSTAKKNKRADAKHITKWSGSVS